MLAPLLANGAGGGSFHRRLDRCGAPLPAPGGGQVRCRLRNVIVLKSADGRNALLPVGACGPCVQIAPICAQFLFLVTHFLPNKEPAWDRAGSCTGIGGKGAATIST
jgi:hypothetical protein